ncbi:hypothetical protein BB559_000405 [Furculomyces boomerangus]|uniref:Uncharacterized protein n=2 Tax=Harpellales TaxID=61421 RepID=A0A2T9Z5I6_9FUNG|nr:hypothetical protein BB559_000405 [Furculomyces boomerangus]PVZ99203.1 hypothetical protein BB558_004781 [Smittium angustum]
MYKNDPSLGYWDLIDFDDNSQKNWIPLKNIPSLKRTHALSPKIANISLPNIHTNTALEKPQTSPDLNHPTFIKQNISQPRNKLSPKCSSDTPFFKSLETINPKNNNPNIADIFHGYQKQNLSIFNSQSNLSESSYDILENEQVINVDNTINTTEPHKSSDIIQEKTATNTEKSSLTQTSNGNGITFPVYQVDIYKPIKTEDQITPNDIKVVKTCFNGGEPKVLLSLTPEELDMISLALADNPSIYQLLKSIYTKKQLKPPSKIRNFFSLSGLNDNIFSNNKFETPLHSFIIDSSHRNHQPDYNVRLLDIQKLSNDYSPQLSTSSTLTSTLTNITTNSKTPSVILLSPQPISPQPISPQPISPQSISPQSISPEFYDNQQFSYEKEVSVIQDVPLENKKQLYKDKSNIEPSDLSSHEDVYLKHEQNSKLDLNNRITDFTILEGTNSQVSKKTQKASTTLKNTSLPSLSHSAPKKYLLNSTKERHLAKPNKDSGYSKPQIRSEGVSSSNTSKASFQHNLKNEPKRIFLSKEKLLKESSEKMTKPSNVSKTLPFQRKLQSQQNLRSESPIMRPSSRSGITPSPSSNNITLINHKGYNKENINSNTTRIKKVGTNSNASIVNPKQQRKYVSPSHRDKQDLPIKNTRGDLDINSNKKPQPTQFRSTTPKPNAEKNKFSHSNTFASSGHDLGLNSSKKEGFNTVSGTKPAERSYLLLNDDSEKKTIKNFFSGEKQKPSSIPTKTSENKIMGLELGRFKSNNNQNSKTISQENQLQKQQKLKTGNVVNSRGPNSSTKDSSSVGKNLLNLTKKISNTKSLVKTSSMGLLKKQVSLVFSKNNREFSAGSNLD